MARNYPDFPFVTDLDSFKKAMKDEDYFYYAFLMVRLAEAARVSKAQREARRRERIKAVRAVESPVAATEA